MVLLIICLQNPVNRDILLQNPNWQTWLLGFLAFVPPQEIVHFGSSQSQDDGKDKKREDVSYLIHY